MKKLMIAAAIVCAAVMSQASTIKWSISDIYQQGLPTTTTDNKAAKNQYAVMCFLTTDTSGDHKELSAAAAKEMASKGQFADLEAKAIESTVNSAKGTHVSASYDGGWVKDDTAYCYAIIFDNADATKAKNFIITSVADFTFADADTSKTLPIGSQKAATWNSISAAPEPTSGLLLLLGVAGLALRRRRA